MNQDFNLEDTGKSTMGMVVRGAGLFILVVGLLVGLVAIWEALQLYHEPDRIERFALAIEKGSNIDKSLRSLRDSTLADAGKDENVPASASDKTAQAPAPASDNVRVSYFLSWVIVLLLLLLIARLALAAMKTGGELALYDMQVKQFARMLVKESGKTGGR